MKGDCVEDGFYDDLDKANKAPMFMWGRPAAEAEKEAWDPATCYDGIDATLAERGSRYGNFEEQGRIEQNIKRAFADSPNWDTLPADSRSALEMIATKISRILKGDPEYADSWHDIIGYAKLVEDRINNGN